MDDLANAVHLASHQFQQTEPRRKEMAKGQLRSNREKKKPKQAKANPAGVVSQFSVAQPKLASSSDRNNSRAADAGMAQRGILNHFVGLLSANHAGNSTFNLRNWCKPFKLNNL